MEIRIFQILVPLAALLFIISFINRYTKSKASLKETIFSIILWLSIAIFSVFPDIISNFVAELFGFKSNINAIIFLSLGVLIYSQFRMYTLIKDQRQQLTKLTRRLGLEEFENKEE